jgi:sugar/nucleoside kinase (ribokinase family)
MRTFDILVGGEINPDLILTGDVTPEFGQIEKLVDSAALAVGSSSAIFACGAARLGLKVAFVGVCGDDVFGHYMLDEMRKRGVDVSRVIVDPAGVTGLSVILNQSSDRAILTFPGLIPALQASDIPNALLEQARHLHVASYFLQTGLQAGLRPLFQRAHSFALTTSLDTNYDPSEKWQGLGELLSETDVFLPNQTEALSLTGAPDVDAAARRLAGTTRLAVIKVGAAGALACEADSITRSASVPVGVVDSVGAGDAFDAGFLFGYLNHWNLEKSLRLACICGALSMRKAGGTDGQPTLEEALSYVSG